jgi:hypothetical protein
MENVINTNRPLIDGLNALMANRKTCPKGLDPAKNDCRECSMTNYNKNCFNQDVSETGKTFEHLFSAIN